MIPIRDTVRSRTAPVVTVALIVVNLMVFLHAVLGGTDFSDPVVSALTWSTAAGLAVLTAARMLWGRLPA